MQQLSVEEFKVYFRRNWRWILLQESLEFGWGLSLGVAFGMAVVVWVLQSYA
jgi:hypothetical protein